MGKVRGIDMSQTQMERHSRRKRVRELRIEGHEMADGLMVKSSLGYLSCEIVVRKTKDIKIDKDQLHAVLERKWEEIFTEVSSLVERPSQCMNERPRKDIEKANSSPRSRSP